MIRDRASWSVVDERGFSLAEMLIAVGVMLAVTAGIFSVLNPAHGTFQAQPEIADMQQRMRIGVDTLKKDLIMAGAGAYMGSQTGSLMNFFSPILPYRQGANAALDDGPGVFPCTTGNPACSTSVTDRITLMYVPQTTAQTTITQPMPNVSAELKVADIPGCPAGQALSCDPFGFKEGLNVLIYDATGAYDTMTITQVQDNAGHLQHNQQGPLSKAYDSGAKITQIAQNTYYYNLATNQLMHYDGSNTGVGVPVVDNVVALSFEFWGDPNPPAIKDAALTPRPSVTYGPSPPALGVPDGTAWPAGTNCTIDVQGNPAQQVSRLPLLGAVAGGLVKLNDPTNAQTSLTDGPWCPDANNINRWDADLLRIRKITVTLRVQAALATLRGPAGTLFTNGGTSKAANMLAPDQEVKFDVTPRNLNLGR